MVDAVAKVESKVSRKLGASSYPGLRRVACRVEAGKLVLAGRVESYYLKQLAGTLAAQVAGHGQIENRLEVLR